MTKKDIVLSEKIWAELKEKGAKEIECMRRMTLFYTDTPYRKIKYGDLEFEVKHGKGYDYFSNKVYDITVKKNGKEIYKKDKIIGEVEVYQFIKEYKI